MTVALPFSVRAFHGTKVAFDQFRLGEDGVCFTTCRRAAARYAGRKGRVIEAEITLLNPYVTDNDGWEGVTSAPAPWRLLEEGEHDGYIVEDWAGPGRPMVIVFDLARIRVVHPGRALRPKAA